MHHKLINFTERANPFNFSFSEQQIKTIASEPSGFHTIDFGSGIVSDLPIVGRASVKTVQFDNFNNPWRVWFANPAQVFLQNNSRPLNLSVDSMGYITSAGVFSLFLTSPVEISAQENKINASIIDINPDGRLRAGITADIKTFFVNTLGNVPVKFVNLSTDSGLLTITPTAKIPFSVPFLNNILYADALRLKADNATIAAYLFGGILQMPILVKTAPRNSYPFYLPVTEISPISETNNYHLDLAIPVTLDLNNAQQFCVQQLTINSQGNLISLP
ncbi:MAG: hypothetical protein LBK68_02030 [Candidatus Margulisbacteria bacterium]|jgi:hypothetical protein|nr:hypothetical protein [Candidatus Margulisiibacteriota bacterium]